MPLGSVDAKTFSSCTQAVVLQLVLAAYRRICDREACNELVLVCSGPKACPRDSRGKSGWCSAKIINV
ncbi:hypothetical protein PF007_g10896 [Phytophthora fragariae]|uniref:Uncharacterized protein n=1 Tax=Phytophthora fragariae TaxID=53985 RepID=A0A6A3SBA7_9STRA|nr:hypothetical protein PF003_g38380 [Phytophthora fragariae]KAE8938191.1 hypothetical protein PF009_g11916 [Phytophthora fragariae]KAE9008584.1 hypothetical protein PF011_g10652 [Phytophthora fragariae]KAE9112980.1 hypothetical protein PF007_g10896 [Phytophthora fragariae]KAE9145637.1 hypothetical protein PF006_g9526 [Phytophthora fragariae]